ncbi:MAG TPA: PQQ-dependent sugar dehydrogenase [Gammaproteobacteria bacterium]|nr:PQQ-dependent sugar dehydrogenase [Gammaproteobacteria bacterium]
MRPFRSAIFAVAAVLTAPLASAQDEGTTWTFDTYTPGPCSPTGAAHGGCPPGELVRIRVVTVAHGLVRPWHLSFLPGGTDMLVTELPGRLRIVRNGKLEPEPIAGWPDQRLRSQDLKSAVLHPDFERNGLVYLSYTKSRDGGDTTVALARARFDGRALGAVEDVFVADAWGTGATAGRAEAGPDGMIYLTVGDRDAGNLTDDPSYRLLAQSLDGHVGKILRLNPDGGAPADNPFAGRADARPEIYSYGHRNAQGLAWHPVTGELWATEIGPMAGDELNRIVPGGNYGWPLVSLGKIYTGNLASEQSWWRPGIEMPVMFWAPAISPSSLMIYDGDQFPLWRGHYFIGGLSGQQLQRVAFEQTLQAERRDSMLVPLDVRVRDVRQGPDGNLYLAVSRDQQSGPGSAQLTPTGSILRIEPAQ